MSKQEIQEPDHTKVEQLDFVLDWISEIQQSQDEVQIDTQLELYDLRKL